MEKPIAVIAFGGNAILDKGDDGSFETQLEKAKTACREMLSILHKGYDICLVHGNGPQVGNLLIQFEKARDIIPVPPLDVAVASSQGLLGHMLEVSMRSVLAEDNMEKDVACILTQVVVDSEDPSFKNPTKPIGPFFTKKDAECLMEKQGWKMVEDAGRGWRRVVASPEPKKIVEADSILNLLDNEFIVIACGGGGIPVVRDYGNKGCYKGVAAVIDKDMGGELLAEDCGADVLFLLTAVEHVAINFGKPDEKWLDSLTPDEARKYIGEGHFAPGSMLPKVEAAVEFAESAPGRSALITLLEKAKDGVAGKTGTAIHQ